LNRKFDFLDFRPIIVALAGPNGAGKSTFYEAHLAESGLRFVNADTIALALNLDAYQAADIASAIRQALVSERESFIFETVLSDPVGEKVNQLAGFARLGYSVVLIFIQLNNVELSLQRVAMRVSQGGHDVPDKKLRGRFRRTLKNLERAIKRLPHVLIFDNSDLNEPFRFMRRYENGIVVSDELED
jgi:predicted ABC-type ATPase